MNLFVRLVGLSLSTCVAACFTSGTAAASQQRCDTQPEFAAADHHMHIESHESASRAHQFCEQIGQYDCGSAIESSTGVDAIRALDAAGIRQGVLLSTAYLVGSPEIAEAPDVVARETRSENSYVVAQARKSHGRLVAFISVNPIGPNALEEIRYWRRHGGVAGLKLHLANSDFEFDSAKQVTQLAEVFRIARAAGFSIVIHLRNRNPKFGSKEVEIFLRDVFPAARGVTVQIAHSGGWGGADRQALAALEEFAHAMERDPKIAKNLYFDTAVMPEMPGQPESYDNIAKYISLMRKIGPKHFLLASDWTKGTDLTATITSTKQRLDLTSAEWHEIAWNAAPYLPGFDRSSRCKAAAAR